MGGNSFDQLVEIFMKFPGIGPRQARRFVYFLLSLDQGNLLRLTNAINSLREESSRCERCGYHFLKKGGKTTICQICADLNRNHSQLMIVEKDLDVDSFKKTDSYNGLFYILGGLVPILDKEPAKKIRLTPLQKIIKDESASGKLQEIILALSANPEGDYSAQYLKEMITPLIVSGNTKISILGRGLSTGTEVEYSDPETLRSALENRH
ncbi:MAG: Recombination protein RecR [Patescibacteria group bacterium]|nr:Recombination protein RecR [Patescibacteria group bacterium]